MTMPAANLQVMVGKQFVCVKIIGRANFNVSVSFQTLLTELRQKGYQHFILELSECVLMDSTFLGVLAGFGLKMTQASATPPPCPVELRNANERVLELLESLGVLHLFSVTNGPLGAAEAVVPQPADSTQPSRMEVKRTCLEAHQTLMEINPDNVAKFKDVARFLAEDLQKLQNER